MIITDYSFGKITVNGSIYTKDVIIFPEHVLSPWWRKEGHILQIADLSDIAGTGISTLIIGTGAYGAMKVPKETKEHLASKNIKVHIERSKEAVKLFNELSKKQPAIAALHLTC